MKRFLLMFFALMAVLSIKGNTTKSRTLSYQESQFTYIFNSVGALEISPASDSKLLMGFDDDTSKPQLPWISVDIAFPLGTTFKNFSVSTIERRIKENVMLAQNPTFLPTDDTLIPSNATSLPQYLGSVYPSENVRYITSSTLEDSVIFHFLVCPFIYKAQLKQLIFISDFTLTINTENNAPCTKEERQRFYLDRKISLNSSDSCSSITNNNTRKAPPSLNGDSIDYIVITSKSLADTFEPWVQWKRQKGLRSMVVTVEDIKETNVSGASTADVIKDYIADLYYINGLKYVLLGGDETIVPVKYCCGMMDNEDYKKYKTEKIPTDLYYACLDVWNKDLTWDKNKNGIFGEVTDSISMAPSISVTRIPVRSSTDVKTTLIKILQYEQQPTANGWNNNILMAGVHLSKEKYTGSHSDTESTSDILYKRAIQPYWDGERKKYYDTCSDFTTSGISSVTRTGLQEILSQGFSFFDMTTHGSNTIWSMQTGSGYSSNDAKNQVNANYTVVTTTSCNTNWFDSAIDPCLSEAFIRNINSGVIAYLGCSRYGWYIPKNYTSLSPSQQFEEKFYRELFSEALVDKNFGTVVAKAKAQMIGRCGESNSYRWIQFGLNPIGDPETPIYTDYPQEMGQAISTIYKGGTVIADAGMEGCNICVMSSRDYGETYYQVRKNVRKAVFSNVSTDVSVCFTKQNYIPKITYLSPSEATTLAAITDCMFDASGNLNISTKLEEESSYSILKVSQASTGYTEKQYEVTAEHSKVTDNASDMANGVHIVSLYVDGTLVDSKSIIKK